MDRTERTEGQDDFLRISAQEVAYAAFHALPDGILTFRAQLALFSGLMFRTHGYRVRLRVSRDILALDDEQAAALLALIRGCGYALHIPRDPDFAAQAVAREARAHRFPRTS
ncbi:hypothetical protein KJ781_03385 [Patescibacteria group bacterium]|nr:hypothetical protein [Patescibacteria group bacterium]MBU1448922.1 hypothetical protein [Patescibacteria group bacterium]MBU2613682.1 hypothetical protein [Patescibacteria group bacterium]